MPRGGARPGAGRKPGECEKTKRRKALADAAAQAGITPLELMLEAMRRSWAAGDVDKAHQFARDAAPYLHPRLTATQVSGKDGGPIQTEHKTPALTPEERRAKAQALAAAAGATLIWPGDNG